MASTSPNLPYVIVASIIIVAVVFGFTVIEPAFREINATRESLAADQAVLAERIAFLRSLDRRLADLEANREQVSRLDVVLPTEKRVEDTLRILHQRAVSAGVVIESVVNNSGSLQSSITAAQARGEESNIPEAVVPLSVNVEVAGPYQGLRAFLTEIERSPRLMDIREISLERTGAEGDQIKGTITIHFYMTGSN